MKPESELLLAQLVKELAERVVALEERIKTLEPAPVEMYGECSSCFTRYDWYAVGMHCTCGGKIENGPIIAVTNAVK